LKQQGISLPISALEKKISDHRHSVDSFMTLLSDRSEMLKNDDSVRIAFQQEMKRFLPSNIIMETIENKAFWVYMTNLVASECDQIVGLLSGMMTSPQIKM
jgi:hypothetical protein